jgi:glycerophosphoryl diester phosphodiesterase
MAEQSTAVGRVKIKLHYFAALILLMHSAFFMVYWVMVGAFRSAVNVYLGELTGWSLPYITILMVLTGLIFLATLVRFIGLRLAVNKGEWHPVIPDWIYFTVWALFLVIFYVAFIFIFQQNPSQKGVVRHLLNLTRLGSDALMFMVAIVWLRRLILYLRRKMRDGDRRWPWTVGITLTLVALVGLWLVPALFPPNWAYQGDLPTKPALIAHRGASMLAPENTLAAADLATTHQALGFETDLRISLDGVPFLMHDETLARTTNIAEIFPTRVDDLASSFTLDELKSLNAGLWFIQKDPFGTIEAGQVSQTQLSINQGQHIPTLAEALDLVSKNGMVILFDMRYPPGDHPYYDDFFEIVLDICLQAQMNSDVWLLLAPEQLATAMDRAPQMTRVVGASSTSLPDVAALLDQDYEIINVDTGIRTDKIRAFREEGLGVNVYTIDEPWLFSQFWLSGVTSVTTNNVHNFNQMDKPLLNVPYARYVLFWGLFGIIVAIWLASSQPQPEPVPPEKTEPPSLLDFDFGDEVIVERGATEEIEQTPQLDWDAEFTETTGPDDSQDEMGSQDPS